MDDDKLLAILDRLEQGQHRLEQGQQDQKREMLDFRVAVMSKFERLENRVERLSSGLAQNVTQVSSILDQLTTREAQLAMLQDAIRAGLNAESIQVRTVHKTVVGLSSIVLDLQSQVSELTRRLDDMQYPMQGS